MNRQGKVGRKRALYPIPSLLLALVTLLACQGGPWPPTYRGARLAQERERSGPVLVRIATCWAAYPLVTDLLAAYSSDDGQVSFEIVPANSQIAVELVEGGQAEVAIAALGAAPTKGVSESGRLVSRALAIDTIGIVVHKGHALLQLSGSELAGLFAGHYLDWDELGVGSGRPQMVSREAGSASRAVFGERIMGELPVSSTAVVMPHDRGVVEYIAQHPGAIGYASTAHVDSRVRLVAIDGILPTPGEVRQGRYSLVYPLVMLLSPDAPREASRFVAFAFSGKGRQVIEQRYVFPR